MLDGLKADVATFTQFTDVQVLHDQGDLIIADWQSRLTNNSVPYYWLPAFLVRKGNPKNIKDWKISCATTCRSRSPTRRPQAMAATPISRLTPTRSRRR